MLKNHSLRRRAPTMFRSLLAFPLIQPKNENKFNLTDNNLIIIYAQTMNIMHAQTINNKRKENAGILLFIYNHALSRRQRGMKRSALIIYSFYNFKTIAAILPENHFRLDTELYPQIVVLILKSCIITSPRKLTRLPALRKLQ